MNATDLRQNNSRLRDVRGTSEATGIPVRTLRTMMHQRKIPFTKTGHRTIFLDPVKVLAALQKFEVREVA